MAKEPEGGLMLGLKKEQKRSTILASHAQGRKGEAE